MEKTKFSKKRTECSKKAGYNIYPSIVSRCLPELCKYGIREKYGSCPVKPCPDGMARYPLRKNKCLSVKCKKGGNSKGYRFDTGYCKN